MVVGGGGGTVVRGRIEAVSYIHQSLSGKTNLNQEGNSGASPCRAKLVLGRGGVRQSRHRLGQNFFRPAKVFPPQEVAEVAEAEVGLLERAAVLDLGQELAEEGAHRVHLGLRELQVVLETAGCLGREK